MKQLQVRLHDAEMERIKRLAAVASLSISDYIRAALSFPPRPMGGARAGAGRPKAIPQNEDARTL